MQTIYLDISNKGVIPTIYAKQGDVGRKFLVVLTDSGIPYAPPAGSVFSAWYEGDSGEGNYTDIGEKSAFSANGNKVTVEMIAQMLSNNGDGVLSLVLNDPNGNQISTWNIPYICEYVPGADSEEAKAYYTAFSKAVENLPYTDASLSVSGKAADAAATGKALEGKAPAGYGLGEYTYSDRVARTKSQLDTFTENGAWSYQGGDNENLTPNGAFAYCYGSTVNYTANFAKQFAFALDGGRIERTLNNGTWGEWEWDNPPMVLGVEYRTMEQWNGEVNYVKLINLGKLPNKSIMNAEGLLPANITPLVVFGIARDDHHHAVPFPNSLIYLNVGGEYGTVYVKTTDDFSSYTAFIIVKYAKR